MDEKVVKKKTGSRQSRTGKEVVNQDGGPLKSKQGENESRPKSLNCGSLGKLRDENEKNIGKKSNVFVDDSVIICKLCDQEFTEMEDQLIECERCKLWECLKCSGMSSSYYEMLNDPLVGKYVHWYCKVCNSLAVKAVITDREIEEQCKHYMSEFRKEISEEIQAVKVSLDSKIDTQIASIKNDIKVIKEHREDRKDEKLRGNFDELIIKMENCEKKQKEISNKLNDNAAICVNEFREREGRKLNLIFFNVPESEYEESDDRKADDEESITEILDSIKIKVRSENFYKTG